MFCEHKKHKKEMALKTIAYFYPRVFKFVCEVSSVKIMLCVLAAQVPRMCCASFCITQVVCPVHPVKLVALYS